MREHNFINFGSVIKIMKELNDDESVCISTAIYALKNLYHSQRWRVGQVDHDALQGYSIFLFIFLTYSFIY